MTLSYRAGLLARDTFYLPLTVARNATREWAFEYPDYDLTGAALSFEVRARPDDPLPGITLTAPLFTVTTTTWTAWQGLYPSFGLPAGASGSDTIKVSNITADCKANDVKQLSINAFQEGANTTFYYDIRAVFPDHIDVLYAGEFYVSGGVSGLELP